MLQIVAVPPEKIQRPACDQAARVAFVFSNIVRRAESLLQQSFRIRNVAIVRLNQERRRDEMSDDFVREQRRFEPFAIADQECVVADVVEQPSPAAVTFDGEVFHFVCDRQVARCRPAPGVGIKRRNFRFGKPLRQPDGVESEATADVDDLRESTVENDSPGVVKLALVGTQQVRPELLGVGRLG